MDFTCPRCGTPAAKEFYGPCGSCSDDLRERAALRAAWRNLVWWVCGVEPYEPDD